MRTLLHSHVERLVLPGSPFELVPQTGNGCPVFRHAPRSLQVLFQSAARFGSRPCMAVDGIQVCFARILGAAACLGQELVREYGVSRGARVAVIAADSPAWLAALAGVWCAGAVAVVVDRSLDPVATLALLDDSRCESVIVDRLCSLGLRDCGDVRAHIIVRHGIDADHNGYFEGVETAAVAAMPSPPVTSDPDEDALIAFTSGSTGAPKGVVSTHRAILSGMLNTLLSAAIASASDTTRGSRVPALRGPPCSLLLSPFSHVGGYSHLILMTHLAGKVIPHARDAAKAIATIAREKVTVLSGASSQMLADLLRSGTDPDDLRSLSAITLYGSAPASRLALQVQSRFPAIRVGSGYGLTETNGLICSVSSAQWVVRPGTCGPVLPSVEVCIRDESGAQSPAGSAGEIWVRGSMLMRGYLSTANGTRPASLPQGWFCTEDTGRLDSDGYLYVSERRQDTFEISGTRISCTRIERQLCEEGLAEDAAAVSVTRHGAKRLVVAIVPPRDGTCRERVADCLRRITLLPHKEITVLMLDCLPRTSAGKPDRPALRRQFIEDQSAAEEARS